MPARTASVAACALTLLALAAALSGCGSTLRDGGAANASAAVASGAPQPGTPESGGSDSLPASSAPVPDAGNCAAKAMQVLQDVATRVYREGVVSERTATAAHFIASSLALREAVEREDPAGVRAAARPLIAAGRFTNLRVTRVTRVTRGAPGAPGAALAELGSDALAPIAGTLTGAAGTPIASYLTSVWSDRGFIAETNGITQGLTVLREHGRSIAGSTPLPGEPTRAGTLRLHGVDYRYSSFPATAYPSGALRVYLLRRADSLAALCGASDQETLVNTLTRVAELIYESEQGAHALSQVRRVQHDRPLLTAVADRDPLATRVAVERLLHEHVVRLRVSAGATLLADVGGPYVLAPVTAPLRLGARKIGSIVLSIQDDEGYKRLTGRLAGLRVLMYMGGSLVKNSLGPSPGSPPANGPYRYRGHSYLAFTLHAQAFPSSPLRIVVLIPIPYS